jgi:hypothetical protein
MTDTSQTSEDRDDAKAGVDDRRQSLREETHVGIRVQVETEAFGGETQNVSRAGIFFFSSDRLRVSVELQEDGETVTRKGHLVRVERMNEDTTGFAIEFDA